MTYRRPYKPTPRLEACKEVERMRMVKTAQYYVHTWQNNDMMIYEIWILYVGMYIICKIYTYVSIIGIIFTWKIG